jgi:hypothetical protein
VRDGWEVCDKLYILIVLKVLHIGFILGRILALYKSTSLNSIRFL